MLFGVKRTDATKIRNWWGGKLPLMACEEAGEFIQAVSKAERSEYKTNRYDDIRFLDAPVKEHLIEEIGDLAISLAAVCRLYDISEAEVQEYILHKTSMRYDLEETLKKARRS